eukprot:1154152-Pelagomonas_calceolata.AAC.1
MLSVHVLLALLLLFVSVEGLGMLKPQRTDQKEEREEEEEENEEEEEKKNKKHAGSDRTPNINFGKGDTLAQRAVSLPHQRGIGGTDSPTHTQEDCVKERKKDLHLPFGRVH